MSVRTLSILLLLFILGFVSPGRSQPANNNNLVAAYDFYLERLLESPDFIDNLVAGNAIVRLPVEARVPNAGIVSDPDVVMVGLAGDTTEPRGQRFMTVPEGGELLYVSGTRDMRGCVPASSFVKQEDSLENCFIVHPGQFIPGLPGYALLAAGTEEVVLTASHMYTNTRFVESLLDMAEQTGNEAYADLARDVLLQTALYYVDSNGVVRLNSIWFNRHTPVYRGMPQGILMHAIHRYLMFRQDENLSNVLRTLSETFVHTTEGSYNHFSNSAMGVAISSEVLGVYPYVPDRIEHEIETMIANIAELDGRISYTMASSSAFPSFRDTYQSYDFFLLARLIEFYYPDVGRARLRAVFPMLLVATERISFPDNDYSRDFYRTAQVVNGLRYYEQSMDLGCPTDLDSYREFANALAAPGGHPSLQAASGDRLVAALHFLSGMIAYDAISNDPVPDCW